MENPYDVNDVLTYFSSKPQYVTKYFLDEDGYICYLFKRRWYSRASVITLFLDDDVIMDITVWRPSDEELYNYFKELKMKMPEFYEI